MNKGWVTKITSTKKLYSSSPCTGVFLVPSVLGPVKIGIFTSRYFGTASGNVIFTGGFLKETTSENIISTGGWLRQPPVEIEFHLRFA
jgi:hypothetical protein